MELSRQQISKIINKLIKKITRELETANRNNCVEEFLEKYSVAVDEEERYINPRVCKIIVIGQLAGKLKDYKIVANKLGVDPERIEFVDYSEIKRYNVSRLENSFVYSDIIVGPMPHKVEGMGDASSFLAAIKKEPNKYPRLLVCRENSQSGGLKISITSFKECLNNSLYLEL